ncbi:hypothetical protein [Nocardioides mesophilus]|uniref:hypothetical protein n=1 Tax=Nocardioides mesophilus TaxID=433659 RepID=UPI001CB74B53|nr:hypothetical protein [Nocardioides mesophilus]
MRRLRFHGRIVGVGSTSGTRIVLGHWHRTPLGAFSDLMVETAAGHRVLVAPREEVAAFVGATYRFDEVRIEPVAVEVVRRSWAVRSPSLDMVLQVGRRTPAGALLHLVPEGVATRPLWSAAADPVSRVVMRGVRTRGSAGAGRREWYGATDVHAVEGLAGRFDGVDLGELAPVDPPCHFGFSSTPRRPSVTDVVTTVEVPS